MKGEPPPKPTCKSRQEHNNYSAYRFIFANQRFIFDLIEINLNYLSKKARQRSPDKRYYIHRNGIHKQDKKHEHTNY